MLRRAYACRRRGCEELGRDCWQKSLFGKPLTAAARRLRKTGRRCLCRQMAGQKRGMQEWLQKCATKQVQGTRVVLYAVEACILPARQSPCKFLATANDQSSNNFLIVKQGRTQGQGKGVGKRVALPPRCSGTWRRCTRPHCCGRRCRRLCWPSSSACSCSAWRRCPACPSAHSPPQEPLVGHAPYGAEVGTSTSGMTGWRAVRPGQIVSAGDCRRCQTCQLSAPCAALQRS